jgi:membrane protein implicated in regulation of membrane protease activity
LHIITVDFNTKVKYKRYVALAITTSLLEQAILVAVVLWLLPRVAINIPLWGLILMIIALGAYNYATYRLGKKALVRKPIISPDIGNTGRTATLISPRGYVRVNGELWQASCNSAIGAGEEIIVVGIQGMTLLINRIEKNDRMRADASSG